MINSFYYLEPASNRWIDFDQAQASFPETSFEVDLRFLAAGKEIHAAAKPVQENVAEKRVPLSVLCVEKIVFSCGSGDHAAAEKKYATSFSRDVAEKQDHAAVERKTQRFQETLLGKGFLLAYFALKK